MAQSSNWLNSLVTNPWFSIISLMIGVLGVILSIYIKKDHIVSEA